MLSTSRRMTHILFVTGLSLFSVYLHSLTLGSLSPWSMSVSVGSEKFFLITSAIATYIVLNESNRIESNRIIDFIYYLAGFWMLSLQELQLPSFFIPWNPRPASL